MYFVSKEAKAFTITGHIMADGTFLYHYSAFKGKPVTLKPEILDNHVVIL